MKYLNHFLHLSITVYWPVHSLFFLVYLVTFAVLLSVSLNKSLSLEIRTCHEEKCKFVSKNKDKKITVDKIKLMISKCGMGRTENVNKNRNKNICPINCYMIRPALPLSLVSLIWRSLFERYQKRSILGIVILQCFWSSWPLHVDIRKLGRWG